MEIMLNSCNTKEIEEALSWGIVKGITMNPSMLARSGGNFVKTFRQIRSMTEVKVFAQVVTEDPQEILEQGRSLASLGENIFVKVHTNVNGIKGMRLLKSEGIRVCATSVHSAIEALIAGAAGADYVALFVGLLAEVDENDSNNLVRDVHHAYTQSGITTKIMAAGRSVNQVVNSASVGIDAITCPFSIWSNFLNNIYTRNRWDAFSADWQKAFGDRNWASELSDKK